MILHDQTSPSPSKTKPKRKTCPSLIYLYTWNSSPSSDHATGWVQQVAPTERECRRGRTVWVLFLSDFLPPSTWHHIGGMVLNPWSLCLLTLAVSLFQALTPTLLFLFWGDFAPGATVGQIYPTVFPFRVVHTLLHLLTVLSRILDLHPSIITIMQELRIHISQNLSLQASLTSSALIMPDSTKALLLGVDMWHT